MSKPTFTDEQIEELLIKCNGQPTKVASALDVSYVQVYRRIRQNPKLLEVQEAERARAYQILDNLSMQIALKGTIKEPILDEEGNPTEQFRDVLVDYKTRIQVIQNQQNLFKGSIGIKDQIEVTHKSGTIDYSKLSDDALKEILNAEVDEEQEST
ncbi:hypothetical protein [Riemerella columbipharyngis]|uniref:Uncharacterized protein n=1 Tax=Riemerella columbipharyngis TaxID=1071918 RepID=A0A1G7AM66_9FLAO|nr:hypothetical protein [Riemerella columbipharyngis]SDE15843.1 hypothetical protein SAMN05421544_10428 [Riemerella columbipharyngis]